MRLVVPVQNDDIVLNPFRFPLKSPHQRREIGPEALLTKGQGLLGGILPVDDALPRRPLDLADGGVERARRKFKGAPVDDDHMFPPMNGNNIHAAAPHFHDFPLRFGRVPVLVPTRPGNAKCPEAPKSGLRPSPGGKEAPSRPSFA